MFTIFTYLKAKGTDNLAYLEKKKRGRGERQKIKGVKRVNSGGGGFALSFPPLSKGERESKGIQSNFLLLPCNDGMT